METLKELRDAIENIYKFYDVLVDSGELSSDMTFKENFFIKVKSIKQLYIVCLKKLAEENGENISKNEDFVISDEDDYYKMIVDIEFKLNSLNNEIEM